MKTYLYFIILIFISCENISDKEDSSDSEKTDIIKNEKNDSNFYSNYEGIDLSNYLLIQKSEKPTTKLTDPELDPKNELVSIQDSSIILRNKENKIIYKTPIHIKGEESNVTYTYMGFFTKVKHHLFSYIDTFNPEIHYFLISEEGSDTLYFNFYPSFSPSGEKVIDIYSNTIGDELYFSYYQLENGRLNQVLNVTFETWMTDGFEDNMFWKDENKFVIGIYPKSQYWEKRGIKSKDYLMLEIK